MDNNNSTNRSGNIIDNTQAKLQRLKNFSGTMISERAYNLIIGATLLWGIAVNIVMALTMKDMLLGLHPAIVIIVYLVGSLGCSFILYRTKNPAVSFAAFTGLAICMGLILTYIVSMYRLGTVSLAFELTAIITVAMMILGTLFPNFFLSIGGALSISLLLAIIVDVVAGLIFHLNMGVLDYVIVIIFSGFVGYDWAKAQAYPKNTVNAIASASDIYVDVVNIFIRLLSILGKKDN